MYYDQLSNKNMDTLWIIINKQITPQLSNNYLYFVITNCKCHLLAFQLIAIVCYDD